MSQALADSLKGRRRIAVNDAFRLAPDADALAANDQAWWRVHEDARKFAGRKFSTNPLTRSRVERIAAVNGTISTTSNSALLAVHVAITVFGATRVELYGVDLRGTHYFGPHVGLANTKPERFEIFRTQFARYGTPEGVEIVNCTKGSGLLCYPFAD